MPTDQELLRVERAVRKAVTSVIEREVPIAQAIRAAAVGLLQGLPDPAAIALLPPERPSERCARQNQAGLAQMAELEAEGRGPDSAVIVAKRLVADPRDPDAVYRRAQALRRLRRDQQRNDAHRASAPGKGRCNQPGANTR